MMAPMVASLVAPIAFSLIQPVVSSLINIISGKGVIRAGKGYKGKIHLLLALSLMIKVLRKGVTRARKGYNNMNHIDAIYQFFHSIL